MGALDGWKFLELDSIIYIILWSKILSPLSRTQNGKNNKWNEDNEERLGKAYLEWEEKF